MSEMEKLDRTILLGNISAIALAIAGAALVFVVWQWVSRHSQLQLLVGVAATLALAVVYVAAASRIVSGAYQVNGSTATEHDFASTAYVHAGPLVQLAPVVAIVSTWAVLVVASRRFARRDSRGPNSTRSS